MAAKKLDEKLKEMEFMTVKEFARRTTYHPSHVRKMLDKGEIKSIKLGEGKRVIPIQAFIDFIESRTER